MSDSIALAALLCLAGPQEPPETIGRIEHAPIREASGLVRSRTHKGIFWTVNDSGNAPRLYAIERTGALVADYEVTKVINLDWEALALDDKGHLFIGDVGNNVTPKGLATRWVYRLKEPDPRRAAKAPRQIAVEKSIGYRFPGKPFDVEGMFAWKGSLVLVSKRKTGEETKLYRLALDGPEDKLTRLEEICVLPGLTTVTGADLSPDGRRLAFCSYRYAAFFELGPDEKLGALASKRARLVRFGKTSVESCAFDGAELILVAENRSIYRVDSRKRPGN